MFGLALAALAEGAEARPYLMLAADSHGFQAMDLGAIKREGLASAEATLIEAPLAGAPIDGKLAPLVERRMAVDCTAPRWRLLSTAYDDAKEVPLASNPAPQDWVPFGDNAAVASMVQDAACLGRYSEQMVSRFLNLGQILDNYQRVWARREAAGSPGLCQWTLIRPSPTGPGARPTAWFCMPATTPPPPVPPAPR
jgi:hypothetical protein